MSDTDTANAGAPPVAAMASEKGVLRVLLVANDGAAAPEFRTAIGLAGHTLAAQCATVDRAVALVAAHAIDIAILVLPLQSGGLEVCRSLQSAGSVPIVVIGDQLEAPLLSDVEQTGVVGWLGRTASVGVVSAALTAGAAWFAVAARLRAERDRHAEQSRHLLSTLENRKLVERAKGIYMRLLGLQEGEAHRRLQQESQKRRLAIADLAKKIIESDELLGG